MKRPTLTQLALVGVGILAVYLALTAPVPPAVAQWLERKSAVQVRITQLQAENAELRRTARETQLKNEELQATAAARDTVTLTRIKLVRATPVPEACAPVVAARDSIIDEVVEERDQYRQLWHDEMQHSAELLAGLDKVTPVLDTASHVLEDAPVQKRGLAKLLPTFHRVTVAAGVDVHGRPNAVFGVGLSWGDS